MKLALTCITRGPSGVALLEWTMEARAPVRLKLLWRASLVSSSDVANKGTTGGSLQLVRKTQPYVPDYPYTHLLCIISAETDGYFYLLLFTRNSY